MRISERIIVVAKLRGITQAEIAEKLNITAAAVSAWTKEGRNPPSKRLSEIAGILGVSAEFLLTGKGGPADPNLEPDYTESQPVEKMPAASINQSDISERLVAIIESQQNSITNLSNTTVNLSCATANQSSAIDKQSDTIASQHHLIEVMVLDNKKGI
ncbi:MAG: helix-turn-helix domain-containing protein [Chitinispirillales bacterium]|jgi:transcriptional regulator with XRE-family HTH domain|nr:helix-turn-helix domain-containing protein [Chitinispirillales bacterium]